MEVLPLTTKILTQGDDLAAAMKDAGTIRAGDIVTISSKAIALTEGSAVSLATLHVSQEAAAYATQCGRSPAFCEAVLQETSRLNGRVIGTCKSALLTQLRPKGMSEGLLLVPNAGMDESNIESGWAVGWPLDPVASLKNLRNAWGIDCGLIMTDSCCVPRRNGVIAFALACVGIDPFKSEVGNKDLFGKILRVTVEATADQLAIVGNYIMGNTAQATPGAIIRGHGIALSTYEGWVSAMDPAKDLFKDVLKER